VQRLRREVARAGHGPDERKRRAHAGRRERLREQELLDGRGRAQRRRRREQRVQRERHVVVLQVHGRVRRRRRRGRGRERRRRARGRGRGVGQRRGVELALGDRRRDERPAGGAEEEQAQNGPDVQSASLPAMYRVPLLDALEGFEGDDRAPLCPRADGAAEAHLEEELGEAQDLERARGVAVAVDAVRPRARVARVRGRGQQRPEARVGVPNAVEERVVVQARDVQGRGHCTDEDEKHMLDGAQQGVAHRPRRRARHP
jgi:hypothetical protein